MFGIEFFKDIEEKNMDYPEDSLMDFMEKLDAKVKYGYIKLGDRIEAVQYEMPIISSIVGMVKFENNDVIFLNPEAIGENNIVYALVHEALHIVIWKLEGITYSEPIVRRVLEN